MDKTNYYIPEIAFWARTKGFEFNTVFNVLYPRTFVCGEWKTTFWFPKRREEKENKDENMRVIKQTASFFDCPYMCINVKDI